MDRPPARPNGDRIWSLDGDTMGTTWSVRLVAPSGLEQAAVEAAIQADLDAVIAVFSPWAHDSEIARFNAAPPGMWALSPALWSVLDASMNLADDTDGAVDPTLGALVDLWGFGPPGPRPDTDPLPSEAEIATALAVSGWQGLRLHRDARAAMQPGGLKLDFSGIAKGHAVDRVSDTLTALGCNSHLVEIGGEMRGTGVKPDAQPWWIGLEPPPGAMIPRSVAGLVDIAVATSGDWRRAFQFDGILYPHTLDGRTGRPVANGVASVTVFHASAMLADAWATALTVSGPEQGLALARAHGIAAQILTRTSEGVTEVLSPAFAAMLDDEA
ncbi:FAD:protein FMN transferase [Brevundimonas subvibrioides]|uniref:FAD:protein FMN transferase n=1 Tax=Brevundimonas subvibrioides (strain ATCC 15264 / DSM 4735 / LMG 14903 / NBRC 16000 / CB 81) TaxID=633149 RepID=D9QP05_BRESC|nr:FAD:protein FMN transferase [Brevundimonas subvibrioides]ADL00438.1 ApbE family lipoprotein [Brevundimonas subvibrioides ATCC 15264]